MDEKKKYESTVLNWLKYAWGATKEFIELADSNLIKGTLVLFAIAVWIVALGVYVGMTWWVGDLVFEPGYWFSIAIPFIIELVALIGHLANRE